MFGSKYLNLYSTTAGSEYWLLYPLIGLASNNVALLVFSLTGLFFALWEKYRKYSFGFKITTPAFYLAIWYVLSFIEAAANRVFFPHYYLLIVPPLALLAGWFLNEIYSRIKEQGYHRTASLFVGILVAITLWLSGYQNFNFYRHYTLYKLGLQTQQTFIAQGWPENGAGQVQLQQLADYLRQYTTPTDDIFYWSEDVQLYYLANRRSPIDLIWPLYIDASDSRSYIGGPSTRYIIVDPRSPMPDWLHSQLSQSYHLETVMNQQEVYRRN
jgi:hypothetical protein